MPYEFDVDFSGLAKLPKIYNDARVQANRERTLAELGQGTGPTDFNTLGRKLLSTDPEFGLSLLRLGQQQEQQQFGRGIQERQTRIAEKAAEEKPQYMKDDSGNIVLIKPFGRGAEIVTPTGGPTSPSNPYAAPGKPPQEHEAKAGIFADRLASAHATITKHEDINKGTGAISGQITNVLPEGVTTPLTGMGALGGAARNEMMNAQRTFMNALLRRESGAAINAGEYASYSKEYFPQPGDSPDVIENKRNLRQKVTEGLMREAGKSYAPPKGFVGSKTKPETTAQQPTQPARTGLNQEAIKTARDNPQAAIAEAKAAIADGKDPNMVKKRLQLILGAGYDTGL